MLELPLLEGVQNTNGVLDFGDWPQYPNISEIESFVAKGPKTIYLEEIPNYGKTAFTRIYCTQKLKMVNFDLETG